MNLKRFPAFVFQMCVFLALFHSQWKYLREGNFFLLLELKKKDYNAVLHGCNMGKEGRSDKGTERSLALVGLICPPAAQEASSSGQYKLLWGKVQDEHIFTAPLFKLRK